MVCSGDDGTHLQTLVGHTSNVSALAVGLNGKMYMGSDDKKIRVWSGMDDTHLHTLEVPKGSVLALAVMRDGTLFSGGGENEGEENVVRIQLFALFDVLSVFLWRVTP